MMLWRVVLVTPDGSVEPHGTYTSLAAAQNAERLFNSDKPLRARGTFEVRFDVVTDDATACAD